MPQGELVVESEAVTGPGPGIVRSLKARTVSASGWVISGAIASNLLRLSANLVVTRLLVPEAFGLMMIAGTVAYIVAMLSDVGIQHSIVRRPRGDDPAFLDTAWTLQILRGALIWLVAICFAVSLRTAVSLGAISGGSAYADPLLPWVIATGSLTSLILGFIATDVASANRRLNAKPILFLDLISQLISLAAMILLAWLMRSVWALVVSGLIGAIAQVLLSHRLFGTHRNRFRFDRPSLRELIGFGKWLALSSAVTALAGNGDRIILAGLVSANVLGMFSVAISLAGVLDIVMQTLFGRVMLPAISEVARNLPERLPATFRRIRWRIDPLVLIFSGALFAMAPKIIETLYDSRYHDAGQMLQILSLGLVVSRFAIAQQAYLALNKPSYLFALNTVRLISVYVLVPASFGIYGLQGALVAIALKDLPALPLLFWFNSRHGLNNFPLEFIWSLFWPVGFALGLTFLHMCTWVLSN